MTGPAEVARLLRQRRELGVGPLVSERFEAGELLELAREAAIAASSPGPGGRGTGVQPAVHSAAGEGEGGRFAEAVTASRESGVARAKDAPDAPDEVGAFQPPMDYDELRAAALACTRCGLADGRTQVVFSDGAPDARLMVVGEAPGATEDRTGLPFVGPAGKLLDLLLATIGLSRRDSVYICNVLKCRPPGNRNPTPSEVRSCAPWLRRQIDLVRPEAILAVGTFSGQLLSGRDMALGALRGEVYSYHGTPLVVTYHPAALLRNSGWIRPTWHDLQLLREVLDAG